MRLKAVFMTCMKSDPPLVQVILAGRLIRTRNLNVFLISMTIAIARPTINDLSSQLIRWRTKIAKPKMPGNIFLFMLKINN